MIDSVVKYIAVIGISIGLLSLSWSSNAKPSSYNFAENYNPEDTTESEEVELPYKLVKPPIDNPVAQPEGGIQLSDPENITTEIKYDAASGNYKVSKKLGGLNYSPPTYMTSDEYQSYILKKQVKDYWKARANSDAPADQQDNILAPKLNVGGQVFDRVFGGNSVSIEPNGSAELLLGYTGSRTENPAIPENNRRVGSLNFDQKIQLNVTGKIGEKLKLTTSYNTEAAFDFENQMKLDYTGYEDEIIQKIEAGNVSFPNKATLISGSKTLFGIKTELQFGRLSVTSVLSQERGTSSEVEVAGGAQTKDFELSADAYDADRHFFLGHYFRDNYNSALANLPFVNSQVNITRIEVWVTNTNTATQDIRSVVGFAELGEDIQNIPTDQQSFISDINANNLPANNQNNLDTLLKSQPGIRNISSVVSTVVGLSSNAAKQQTNYELISSARKLAPTEYTLQPILGYISLRQKLLPSQSLTVAYQYTINGQVYQVGEFSDAGISSPDVLITKMLKSTATNTKHPMWDLMMKNIYSIGAYQVQPTNFRLNILYSDRTSGIDLNYLPVSDCQSNIYEKPLLQVMELDRLNPQNDAFPDGQFDFIESTTIISRNGLIIFPVIEPFGSNLSSKFINGCAGSGEADFAFPQLYDSTKVIAQQFFPQLNRYSMNGQYQSSSSSEISLGSPNVAQGSVVVTAGGIALTENVDYTVDYTLGRVKIINEGILNSGTPVKVKSGSNSFFNQQQKRLLATRLDYRINKDFNIGATIMNLTERPINTKVNVGFEPISNTIVGMDVNYQANAPFLTRFVDKLPFIDTKTPSSITAKGEFAYLIPGYNKAIGENGNSYIDDFEATQSAIDLRSQNSWVLASTPQGQPSIFPEGELNDSLAYGYNRAKLAWYMISQEMLRTTSGITPGTLSNEDLSSNFTREVLETEVFPNRQLAIGTPQNLSTLDLAYYPSEIGPYNFDVTPTAVSSGLNSDGTLNNPASRWGGIMRAIQTTDFQAANVEYIQFWVMDPFHEDNPASEWNSSGELFFHLGNISEDILKDGQKSAENGLPTPITTNVGTVPTTWGQAPSVQPLLQTFNNDPLERPYQDVGLDGLANTLSLNNGPTEQSFYTNYLSNVQTIVPPNVFDEIENDPAHDDFHYFRGSDYDALDLSVLERYKDFNGLENNSRTTEQSPESYPTASSLTPNVEDINQDNNLSTAESYFEYKISLKPSDFNSGVGNNYITNVLTTNGGNIKDGTTKPIKWYQFKIPIKSPERVVGSIENFQAIRFIRMYMKGVDKPIVLRFARLELLRADWRKYDFDITQPGIYIPNDNSLTTFDVAAVNLEENGTKQPVNYILPPNIERQVAIGTAVEQQLNEQSLSVNVCDLEDGLARAAFKNTELDALSFKNLELFVHGEAVANKVLNDDDLSVFIRLGSDYTDNYYEYEIPLKVTEPGSYNQNSNDDKLLVWPEANNMIVNFEKLISTKLARDASATATNIEYTQTDGTSKISVKGNPNLGAIRTIMLGVRNPKASGSTTDDGLSKCAEIWFNELRLTGFDQQGGGAALASVSAQLADLGSVSISGNMYTPGFGSIENKVSERKRETLMQYNLASNIALDKFLPERSRLKIPMYAGYSETFITPQFNPLAPDVLLKPYLKTLGEDEKKTLKDLTQDYTEQKSINFSNVRIAKNPKKTKSRIYDLDNFSGSYAYKEQTKRNPNTAYDSTRNHSAGMTYNYSPTPKIIQPFKKYKAFKSKHLKLIKDFNFYPYPNKLSFSTQIVRDFNTFKFRDITSNNVSQIEIPATYNKRIDWTRNYALQYPLTKALKLSFTANNAARVLEAPGAIDTRIERRQILKRLSEFGTTTNYNSQFNANYKIPINKLPFLDFTKASVKYTGTYNWQRAPFGFTDLGNTVENSQSIGWSGGLKMNTLYNKIPYLKKVNSSRKKTKKKTPKSPSDTLKTKKVDLSLPINQVVKVLMGLKNVNVSYTTNQGTLLPGYGQTTNMFGLDNQFKGPTPGFVLGSQANIQEEAIKNDWLVKNSAINSQYKTTYSENLNIRANVQPVKSMKITISALRAESRSYNELFRWSDSTQSFRNLSPVQTGNFSMSFLALRTSFGNPEETFQQFLANREIISTSLGNRNPNSTTTIGSYAEGYNETSQDVLISSFISAYSGKDASKSSLSALPRIPKPNWRLTYNGLSKIKSLRKIFRTITIGHGYKSTYSVGTYTSNLLFGNGSVKQEESSLGNNPNFQSRNLISTITLSEQWSPLIKLNVVFRNSITANIEFKKSRNLSLGLTSKTITEVFTNDIVIGGGYTIKKLKLPKTLQINGKRIQSDLRLLANVSFRKNETLIRQIEEGTSQKTGGTNTISIKVSADYKISTKVNIRLYYDRIANTPVISNSFPTANTNAGVSIRLSLAN